MATSNYEKSVTQQITSYQKTTNLLFASALIVMLVLGLHTYQQLKLYKLATITATIEKLEKSSYSYEEKICSSYPKGQSNCRPVTIERPRIIADLTYIKSGETYSFQHQFDGYPYEHLKEGDRFPIVFSNGKPTLNVPSQTYMLFLFVVLAIGLLVLIKWLLPLSTPATLHTTDKSKFAVQFSPYQDSHQSAILSIIATFLFCCILPFFKAHIILGTTITLLVPILAFKASNALSKKQQQRRKEWRISQGMKEEEDTEDDSNFSIAAICLIITIALLIPMSKYLETYAPSKTTLCITVAGFYFISLLPIKKLRMY